MGAGLHGSLDGGGRLGKVGCRGWLRGGRSVGRKDLNPGPAYISQLLMWVGTLAPVWSGSTIPLTNRTTAIAQVIRVEFASSGLIGGLGRISAVMSASRRCMKVGQDGAEMYKLIWEVH